MADAIVLNDPDVRKVMSTTIADVPQSPELT
jgi:hypothetical protein